MRKGIKTIGAAARALLQHEDGQGTAEYGAIIGVVVLVALGAWLALGTGVQDTLTAVGNAF